MGMWSCVLCVSVDSSRNLDAQIRWWLFPLESFVSKRNKRGRVSEWERHFPEVFHLFCCCSYAALINWELKGFGRMSDLQIQLKTTQEMRGWWCVGRMSPFHFPCVVHHLLHLREWGFSRAADLSWWYSCDMVNGCFPSVFKAVTLRSILHKFPHNPRISVFMD